MTDAQWLALIGGAFQVAALVWAWVVLYKRWRRENPGEPVLPRTVRALNAVRRVSRTVWDWLTLAERKPQPAGMGAAIYADVNVVAEGEVRSHGTLEERLNSLEARLSEIQRHTTEQFFNLRTEMYEKLALVAEEHRRDRVTDHAKALAAARFSLGYAAALAVLGTIVQTLAAFASTT